ncbi:MAG: hypothetical protein COW73_02855 [Nitrospirae bacterium CG18_big_fil_WC_8_21_14_2_50_70_55]|nr:MAG: hypothetical protein COW73_02855 [Nitrospirae bacterium CG18_big_fil_WC_8_21_14_2_50_70_55]PIU78412.1 MAG: hypothetical protein COS73_07160 [Nitrospirae bacterium CG06_land_8_20_14_3_00_70_43]PIW84026.1 MAG: hypothetical protein COZ96_00145 [Nitrospirae bacterium CG_4_8_14_3_um_filter_70_85]HBB40715.1 hypothetical protein [Pseudomonadota bacterium]
MRSCASASPPRSEVYRRPNGSPPAAGWGEWLATLALPAIPHGGGAATEEKQMSISSLVSPQVVSVTAGMSIQQAARWMKSRGVGCVAVVDGEQPLGLVTDRDIAIACGVDGVSPDGPVRTLARHPPVTVLESTPLPDAIAAMARAGVRRLMVTDGVGRIVGILSADDLIPLLGEELAALGETVRFPHSVPV